MRLEELTVTREICSSQRHQVPAASGLIMYSKTVPCSPNRLLLPSLKLGGFALPFTSPSIRLRKNVSKAFLLCSGTVEQRPQRTAKRNWTCIGIIF